MKGLLRKAKKGEQGASVVWFLLVSIMLVLITVNRIEYNQAVTHIEVDLQETLKKAVKAAAGQVSEKSQANGDPRIESERANEAFRLILAKNLKLNPITLQPQPRSPLTEAPDYKLLVYNGDDAYVATGARAAYLYDFSGGTLSSYPLSGFGFPKQFAVSDFDINYGAGGAFEITFTTPGCIAVLQAGIKSVTGNEIRPVRWAPAAIHISNPVN